jgi:hypothetical protein
LPLHTAGRDGRCEHCEVWPCSDSLAHDQVDDTTPGDAEDECICTTAVRAQGMHVEECPLFDTWSDRIKPRQRDPNPRCSSCKTGPMFHPAHKWTACQVSMPGGGYCGCTVGVQQPAW